MKLSDLKWTYDLNERTFQLEGRYSDEQLSEVVELLKGMGLSLPFDLFVTNTNYRIICIDSDNESTAIPVRELLSVKLKTSYPVELIFGFVLNGMQVKQV